MENIKKILIIRLGAIGDVVHTTEVYRSIKRKYPDIKIHYLTSTLPSILLNNDPDIEKIITVEKVGYNECFQIAKELKSEKYDIIINLQPSLKLKLLSYLLHPKKVLNYKKTYKLHAVENFFNTAQKYFKELELSKKLELKIPGETIEKVGKLIPKDTKIVAISTQVGPIRHGKKWNIENFKELALELTNKYNVKVLIIGSSEDKPKAKIFNDLHPDILNYTGMFNIQECAALLSHVDIVIAADTAPTHIASALEKPTCIGLYGSMSTQRTGIFGSKHISIKSNLKCVPCQKRYCTIKKNEYEPCMEAIKVSDVMDAIEGLELL